MSVSMTFGESLDRFSILLIKASLSADWGVKLKSLRRAVEVCELLTVRLSRVSLPASDLIDRLSAVNKNLWNLENEIRELHARNRGKGLEEWSPDDMRAVAFKSSMIIENNKVRHKLISDLDYLAGDTSEPKSYYEAPEEVPDGQDETG